MIQRHKTITIAWWQVTNDQLIQASQIRRSKRPQESGLQTLAERSLSARLDHAPATADQVENQHNDRGNDQQMNQPTADAADKPQQPQNQQNDHDCPKHNSPPGVGSCLYLLRDERVGPLSPRLFTFQMIRAFRMDFRAVLHAP
jgi:hypothetical protein